MDDEYGYENGNSRAIDIKNEIKAELSEEMAAAYNSTGAEVKAEIEDEGRSEKNGRGEKESRKDREKDKDRKKKSKRSSRDRSHSREREGKKS